MTAAQAPVPVAPGIFRARPVVVEAVRLSEDNLLEVAAWVPGSDVVFGDAYIPSWLLLESEFGDQTEIVVPGDWVVRTPGGRFVGMSDDEFHLTYSPIVNI